MINVEKFFKLGVYILYVNVKALLFDYLLSKFMRKFHQIVLVIFVGSILGGFPNPVHGIVGSVLFLLGYLSTYLYNDIMDYEEDRAGPVYREKILVRGKATLKEFIILLGFLTPTTIFLATLWDPLLGFFTLLAVLTNNVRTHMRRVVKRQVALMLVEFFNFEAFWQAFYGSPIPAIFTPFFVAYSAIYAVSHGVYKLRAQGELKKVLHTREMRVMMFIALAAVVFSLPALVMSVYHFLLLLVAFSVYAVPQYVFVSKVGMWSNRAMDRIMSAHYFWITLVSLILLLGAFVYVSVGDPLRVAVPFSHYLQPYYRTAEYFDALQSLIMKSVFGGLNGLKTKMV